MECSGEDLLCPVVTGAKGVRTARFYKKSSANVLKALEILFVSTNSIKYRYLQDRMRQKEENSLPPPFPLITMSTETPVTDYKPHNSSRVSQRGKKFHIMPNH